MDEGDIPTTLTITVLRGPVGPIFSDAEIGYAFVPISATPEADYSASDGIIRFTSGKNCCCQTVGHTTRLLHHETEKLF